MIQSIVSLSVILSLFFVTALQASESDICDSVQECKELIQKAKKKLMILVPNESVRTSRVGEKFHKEDHNLLENAWRDPKGILWGDAAVKDEATKYKCDSDEEMGDFCSMEEGAAERYCLSLGARLPTLSDFHALRESMGAQKGSSKGYNPFIEGNPYFGTILPNTDINSDVKGFWLTTDNSYEYYYSLHSGAVDYSTIYGKRRYVRCVM